MEGRTLSPEISARGLNAAVTGKTRPRNAIGTDVDQVEALGVVVSDRTQHTALDSSYPRPPGMGLGRVKLRGLRCRHRV